MSPFAWGIIGLIVGAGAGYLIGVRRVWDGDELEIASLRHALAETQRECAEAWDSRADAVAAQEAAEKTLKDQFERRSEAAKEAWKKRKAPAPVEVSDAA